MWYRGYCRSRCHSLGLQLGFERVVPAEWRGRSEAHHGLQVCRQVVQLQTHVSRVSKMGFLNFNSSNYGCYTISHFVIKLRADLLDKLWFPSLQFLNEK